MTKTAFLGAGNMAAAMVDGLLAQGTATPAGLLCMSGPDPTAENLARRTGITHAASLAALLGPADTLVVAFKPQHLAEADPLLCELTKGRLVISILAGKKLAALSPVFSGARNLVRAMPNTPARIGAGITGWCSLAPLTPADRAIVDRLLGALGKSVPVGEDQMDAVTAVSGSGPAYVFEFAAALREGALAAGLPLETARTLTVETLLGAARLLAESGTDPEELRRQVTSPNGTTFAGLRRMEAGNFRGLIRETVLAAKARSEELSAES